VLLLGLASAALADATFQEQNERLQLISAYLVDFRPGGAPIAPSPAEEPLDLDFDVALQLGIVPDIDSRVGRRDEHLDPPDVIIRPRARIMLGLGLFLGATYTPPIVTWNGYQSEIVGVETGFRYGFDTDWLFAGLRGSYTHAHITGPVTQVDAHDRFTTDNFGLDLTFGAKLFGHFVPWGGVGYGHVDAATHVEVDGVHLSAQSDYPYGLIGIDILISRFTLSFEQDFSEDFLQHIWVGVAVRF
jgi:hypothetical protein